MTVPSSTSQVSYSGNGSTLDFAVSYYFLENSHLKVILRSSTGVETVQTITTNYTVTGAGEPSGGTVSMLVAPPTGTTLVILRNVPATQETDYLANDPFPAESHERALDKLTMLVQQNQFKLGRAIVAPDTDSASLNMTLPSSASRVGKLLTFDADGEPIAGPSLGTAETIVDNLDNINTVADNIDDVNIVADNVTDLTMFTDIYQGAKATAPTLRNDGTALQAGDLYFNTSTDALNIYTGTGWVTGQTEIASIKVERFSGDDSEVDFVLDELPSGIESLQIYINGIYQQKDTFTLIGSTVRFSEAPLTGTDNIEIVNIPNASSDAAAAASALLAEAWATQLVTPVADGEYSSKYYSQASAASAVLSDASKDDAVIAQLAAEAALDTFTDIYLGSKTDNPTVDNDGNPLQVGALYFNSVANEMRVWNGSAWVAAYASSAGYLAAANNLSDLANASTARTNLGLGTIATQGADAVALTGGTADSLTITNGTANGVEIGTTNPDIGTFTVLSDQYGNARDVPKSGAAKTSSYSLQTSDIGQFIEIGSGGSVTIPDATFAAGDIISLFNNTTGNITVTCTITTAYIGGTDSDKSTVTLATRGVATILFISGTVCVINGNVT